MQKGKNYGWPCWEGNDKTGGYSDLRHVQDPLRQRRRPEAAVHVAPRRQRLGRRRRRVLHRGRLPGVLQRHVLLRRLRQAVAVATRSAGGTVAMFGTGDWGADVAIHTGPNGDIFLANLLDSTIVRLRYTPVPNQFPIAHAHASVTAGQAPLAVTFTSTGSTDPDGTIQSYQWDFGDGSPVVSGATASAHLHRRRRVHGQADRARQRQRQLGRHHQHRHQQLAAGAHGAAAAGRASPTRWATPCPSWPRPPTPTAARRPPSPISRCCTTARSRGAATSTRAARHRRRRRTFTCVIDDHGDDTYLEVVVTALDSGGRHARPSRSSSRPASTRCRCRRRQAACPSRVERLGLDRHADADRGGRVEEPRHRAPVLRQPRLRPLVRRRRPQPHVHDARRRREPRRLLQGGAGRPGAAAERRRLDAQRLGDACRGRHARAHAERREPGRLGGVAHSRSPPTASGPRSTPPSTRAPAPTASPSPSSTRRPAPTPSARPSAGLGFGTLPGVAVALDTFKGPVDPSNNFVGITNAGSRRSARLRGHHRVGAAAAQRHPSRRRDRLGRPREGGDRRRAGARPGGRRCRTRPCWPSPPAPVASPTATRSPTSSIQPPAPSLTVAPTSLDFGAVAGGPVGDRSRSPSPTSAPRPSPSRR